MNRIIELIIEPLYSFFRGLLSYFVPKRKHYYAFYPKLYKDKFAGNVKAFMLYLAEHHPEIDIVLLSFEQNVIKEGQHYGLKTKQSLMSVMWASLRAEHVFIDASTSGNFRWGVFSLIQLWHGSGFKEVGFLREIPPKTRRKLKAITKRYRFIVSTSESEAEKMNASFKTNKSIICGYPRNDMFYTKGKNVDELKSKYNLENYDTIITYAPTFRDSKTEQPFSLKFYKQLQEFLEKNNGVFIINKHPLDQFFNPPENFKNIKDYFGHFDDVQDLLLISDTLISDYSSIITDFALTQRPILIYPYDLEEYKKTSREIYYDIEEIFPKPFIKNENDLLEKLKDDSWMKSEEAIKSYDNFVQTFHKYLDGNSSQRVLEAVRALQ